MIGARMPRVTARRAAWRPTVALLILAIGAVVPLADAELGGHLVGSPFDTLGVAVAGFLVGAWVRAAVAAPACLLGALALTVANQRVDPGRYSFANDYFFFALLVGATALAGALIGARLRQVHELRRLEAVRRRQHADELSAAQLEERLRLESQVTQTAMQQMGAVLVQASGARRLPPGQQLRETAAGIERAARVVADDLRATVGSLRAPVDDPVGADPDNPADPEDPETRPPDDRRDRRRGLRLGWSDVLVGCSGLPLTVEVLTDPSGPIAGLTTAGSAIVVVAAGLLLGLPLAVRRTRPVAALGAMLAVATATSALLIPLGQTASVLLPVSLAGYAVGAHARRWARAAGVALLAGGCLAIELIGRREPLDASELIPTVVWLGVAVLSGVAARHQENRAEVLRRLLRQTEAGAYSRLRLALAEQRQAVARDLHDGLALAVTVITLQAQAAQRVDDPGQIAGALEAVETAARDAMAQLRDGLATLEGPGPSGGLEVDVSAFAAWLGVRLRPRIDEDVPGEEHPLVRRVVRESLINIARHAPGADVDLLVRAPGWQVTVEVVDSGARPGSRPGTERRVVTGTGTGLLGLAEAVRRHGGRFEHGRTEDGGFRVAARWPRARSLVPVTTRRRLRARSTG